MFNISYEHIFMMLFPFPLSTVFEFPPPVKLMDAEVTNLALREDVHVYASSVSYNEDWIDWTPAEGEQLLQW